MFVLAHLSDPHLGPLPAMQRRDFVSKRLFGYLNWQRNRRHGFQPGIVAALVEDMRAQAPDHVVVTGDLVNLGFPAEFSAAHGWLASLGSPSDVTVIPGNHDAYVTGAFEEAIRLWRDFMTEDGGDSETARFPFTRRRGPVGLVGLSTAVPTAPLMATGRITADQAKLVGEQLRALGAEGRFRIVLIHHPPIDGATSWHKRLIGGGLFRAEIARHGAELVLHGHNHHMSVAAIAGAGKDVPVVGAAALSRMPRDERRGGSYNLFRIDAQKGVVTLTERGIAASGGEVETFAEEVLGG